MLKKRTNLRWRRLDNAANIYPAARTRNWSNLFRISATLNERIDVPVLQSALDVTVQRFPIMAARLRRGAFWFYLQQLERAPKIKGEYECPLAMMEFDEMRQCAFRVIVYNNRIAVEFFHALTDGTGAMIFTKSLLAEYIERRYGVSVPATDGVLDRKDSPKPSELSDDFQKYAGKVQASRRESDAWKVTGTREEDNFYNLTCFRVPAKAILSAAHERNVTVTAFLGAVMMSALQRLQKERVPFVSLRKPIKVLIPVNLRNLFRSNTLRNFAMYTIPEIDTRLGEYDFDEICKIVHHKMGMDITAKNMSKMIATNVSSERLLAVRLMPLAIKNLVMKAVFGAVGEKKSCLSMSNVGVVKLPEEMKRYIDRMDFILGVQAKAPYNCGILSYGDETYINFIRNIKEPYLEAKFHEVLRDMGIPVTVESNARD